MADFYREMPTFELKFACNFKGCLDNRPMSVMSAIEHQAFHFCETFKTQVHFNFKCEFCNVYHVNKSHHRLCLNEPTGQGHTSFLRTVFTVPMTDQEFHDCVDFSRFASQHMLAVTAEGVRLVPAGSAGGAMPQYNFEKAAVPDASVPIFNNKRSSGSYRDFDNNSTGGESKYSNDNKFNRSGGDFSDRNDSRDYRGRGGRGSYRGRVERGRFFRGGRGRGGGRRDGDDDNGYFGRDTEYRRGRGRGGGSTIRDSGYDSLRSRGNDSQFRKNRSYSRSRSGSPVAAAKAPAGFNSSRARSYSRSGSASPPPVRNTNNAGATRMRSYSRSCSNSPPPPKKQNTETASRGARSYSRSHSESPSKSKSPPAPVKRIRPPASYSRSGSSSDAAPRNDENNNSDGDDQENTHPDSLVKNEDYLNDGYGCGRILSRGRVHTTPTTPPFAGNDAKSCKNRQSRLDTFSDSQCDNGKSAECNVKRKRERSYSKSSSASP